MSKGLEKLKEIGAQRISEDTHIPVEHVQAIIHQSFDSFTRVQFLGFVSILEREYGEDLSDLRFRGLESFEPFADSLKSESVFISPKRKKSFTALYLFLAIIALGAVAYYNIYLPQETTEIEQKQSNIDLNQTQSNAMILENNTTILEGNNSLSDINSSELVEESSLQEPLESEEPVEQSVPAVLKFSTKSKLWLGYIDLQTNRRYDKSFAQEFELDATKSWLLVLGHKFVNIELKETTVDVSKESTLRFLYKDAKIEPLTLGEFKKLNKGRAW